MESKKQERMETAGRLYTAGYTLEEIAGKMELGRMTVRLLLRSYILEHGKGKTT